MAYKDCPNCRTMQEFRFLTGEEKTEVRLLTGFPNVDNYIRCAHRGCVRYQQSGNVNAGGDLPEKFR
ncbi:hypothetical protein [Streptomyces sp. NPDC047525]|uniref:hypothetical protein n=1 Tax=Streptomyces sp. NPDC047525 TaxID=3155264 RepID=UPI0033CA160B